MYRMCDKNRITVWANSTTKCLHCRRCRRGWGATQACGNVLKYPVKQSDIICVRCQKRKKFSSKKSEDMCKPCKVCKPGQKIEKKCTRRSDTVCGGAKKGYYKKTHEIGITTYEKCSFCCGDSKDKRIPECKRQPGQPLNQVCSPSDERRCAHSLTTTRQQELTTKPPEPKQKVIEKKLGIGDISQPNKTHPVTTSALPQNSHWQRNAEKSDPDLHYKIIIPLLVVVILLVLLVLGTKIWRARSKRKRKQSNLSDLESGDIEFDGQQEKLSATVEKYLADTNKNSKYDEMCRIMNDRRRTRYIEHFNAIGDMLRIDPLEVEHIREDQHEGGAFQRMLIVLKLTKYPPTTLEMIAQAVEGRGYENVAALLREEDKRLLSNNAVGDRDQLDEESSPASLSERPQLVVKTTSSQQSSSVKVSEFLRDEKNLETVKWKKICGVLNDRRRPQHKEHLIAIGKDLGIEPKEGDILYDSQQVELFQEILGVVKITMPDPPVTLETIAQAVEKRGYEPATILLREEDKRLLNGKEKEDSNDVAEDPDEITPLTGRTSTKTGEEFGPLVTHPIRGNVVSR